MKTKEFIQSVDRSLLTTEERRLKRIFVTYPQLSLEDAKKVLKDGIKAIQKNEPVEVKLEAKPKPKAPSKPKAKAKPKPKIEKK